MHKGVPFRSSEVDMGKKWDGSGRWAAGDCFRLYTGFGQEYGCMEFKQHDSPSPPLWLKIEE